VLPLLCYAALNLLVAPGLNSTAIYRHARTQGGLVGFLSLGDFSLSSLGIDPYLQSSAILLISSLFMKRLRRAVFSKGVPPPTVEQTIVFLAVFVAFLRSYSKYIHLKALSIEGSPLIDPNGAFLFIVSQVVTSVLVIYLARRATKSGILNGVVLFAGYDIFMSFASSVLRSAQRVISFEESPLSVFSVLVLSYAAAFILRFLTFKTVTAKNLESEPIRIPLNLTGVVPIAFSQGIIGIIAGSSFQTRVRYFDVFSLAGEPLTYLVLFVAGAFLWTLMGFDTRHTSRVLVRHGIIHGNEVGVVETGLRRRRAASAMASSVFLWAVCLGLSFLRGSFGEGVTLVWHAIVLVYIGEAVHGGVKTERRIAGEEWSAVLHADTELEARLASRALTKAGVANVVTSNRVFPIIGTTAFWNLSVPRFPYLIVHRHLGSGVVAVKTPRAHALDASRLLSESGFENVSAIHDVISCGTNGSLNGKRERASALRRELKSVRPMFLKIVNKIKRRGPGA
jgi:preprotein translocase subunit SecY